MESCYVMLDVGGTGVKAGVFSPDGCMDGPACSFDAKAKEGPETIFNNFAFIIGKMAAGRQIDGIGMAFPGPFDYKRGISLMQGLNKYDSIYGMDITKHVTECLLKSGQRMCPADGCRFLFLHDVEAFALGTCLTGKASQCGKVICVCIGTGAGSAFLKDGKVLKEAGGGVPENGWIYNTKYKDAVIDDYLSVRGLGRLIQEYFPWPRAEVGGAAMDGAKLFLMAESGDDTAREVFARFGADVKEALLPFLAAFQPDGLILGGQIAKSFRYFGKQLSESCRQYHAEVFTEPDTSVRAMEGLYAAWMNTMEESKG